MGDDVEGGSGAPDLGGFDPRDPDWGDPGVVGMDDPIILLANRVGDLADATREQNSNLHAAIQTMRRSRLFQWIALTTLALVILVACAGYIRDRQQRCERGNDIRVSIIIGQRLTVNTVGRELGLPENERNRLADAVENDLRRSQGLQPQECDLFF